MEAGIGRFGPYVKMGPIFASLDKDDDVLSIGLNRAVDALQKKLESVRTIGPHPKTGEPIMVKKGRFGPYIQSGQVVANVPRGVTMEEVTAEQAVALLQEKGKPLKAKPGAKKGAKKAAPKVVASKEVVDKPPAPKPAARKPAKKAKPKARAAKARKVG